MSMRNNNSNATIGDGRKWTGQSMGSRIGLRGFFVLLRIFGRKFAGVILVSVSLFYYLFIPSVRKRSRYYLSRRFPDRGPVKMWFCGWRLTHSFSAVLLDRLYLRMRGGGGFSVDFPDTGKIKDALRCNKGVIILSAHIGNWEIAGRFFRRLGAPVSVVMFENERPEIKELLARHSREGELPFEPVFSNDPLDTILRIRGNLAENGIIVMHGDRSMNGKGIVRSFLGKDAVFPDTPYRIAAVTGAPIVSAFSLQNGPGSYRVIAMPHFFVENTDKGIKTACGRYVRILEDVVQTCPWQWYNFFDFWKEDAVAPVR